jgi:glycosyltransferase involved in cell wall biosynthesis
VKGILDLIGAMGRVRKLVPNAKCLIYGSASDLSYAQLCLETRDRLDLTDSIHFMGFTTETPTAFNSGDIATLPSISEGFPFSLIEGMACGKATVATNVGGVEEALADTGIVVPPRNPPILGEALAQLLTDSTHAKKLGGAARDRTISEYPVSRFANQYRGIYREMSVSW